MHKVTSHTEDLDIHVRHHSWGNGCADYHTEAGAIAHKVPDLEEQAIGLIDAEAYLILNRIIAIVETFPKINRDRDSNRWQVLTPKKITQQQRLQGLGHQIAPRETRQSPYKCLSCGQNWSNRIAINIVMQGNCPGPQIWGNPEISRP